MNTDTAGQSCKQSLLECIAGTLIGYMVALGTQLVIYPIYGISIGVGGNASIALLFTVVSFVRSYLVRRLFNWIWVREAS